MTIQIAINGFGRIGRNILRALYETGRKIEINVVAINELANIANMSYLLKYDSTHGSFNLNVGSHGEKLFIENDSIDVFHISSIDLLPWKKLEIDIVLDCTGVYGSLSDGKAHLNAGAKKVLFSHPADNNLDATVVFGINEGLLRKTDRIVSNGSCTTNCVIPIIKILDEAFSVKCGAITVIHSAMQDQNVIDSYKYDFRRSRAASQSIIPVDTRLADHIGRILPKFKNCFQSTSLRVPTINVTAIDISILVRERVDILKINTLLKSASETSFHGIIDYKELPLVSVDFNHDAHSVIVDGTQTRVSSNHLVKVFLWCDNEWGFANRMLDTALVMAKSGL